MKKLFVLAVAVSALFSACQKNSSPAPDASKNIPGGMVSKNRALKDTDVYVAGNIEAAGFDGLDNTSNVPAYWKNGVVNILPAIVSGTGAQARAIAVAGTDVYVAGYDHGTLGTGIPCYWKNSVEYQLPIPAGHTGKATAIALSGTDVYIVGYYVTSDAAHSRRAMLWKNGVATLLSFNNFDSIATGIALDGTDVYICGNATFNGITCAVYWKNNIWHPFTGTTVASAATAITVDSNHNYYISGAYNGNACYWKDANIATLTGDLWAAAPPYGDEAPAYIANNIAVNNGNVYVGGSSWCQSCSTTVTSYWKNGQLVQLHDGIEQGGAGAIQVVGNDVYMTVASVFPADNLMFWYLKNGKTTYLTNAYYAAGIAVVIH
jgi:hypothetical protein